LSFPTTHVLQGLEAFGISYLDDILIFSKTLNEQLSHIHTVFSKLKEHKLKLKLKKCSFIQQQTKYLDFIIDHDGIKTDPETVKAIRSLPGPKCVKDVRSLLGAAGFYRRFCPKYTKIVEPLINLTRKRVLFKWTKECQESFEQLKRKC
jgi:hypothetical protein